MKVDKKVIEYIFSEKEKFDEYIKFVATHETSQGRVIAKLLFYRKSVWDAPKKKSNLLLVDGDAKNAGFGTKTKSVDTANDGVIPFVLILQGNEKTRSVDRDGNPNRLIETGSIYQVSRGRVTGEATNPEFAMMADMIKKNRTSKDGKVMLEAIHTPEQKIAMLERNWGGLRIENPWYKWSEDTDLDDYLFYELPTPEIKGKVRLEILKELLNA